LRQIPTNASSGGEAEEAGLSGETYKIILFSGLVGLMGGVVLILLEAIPFHFVAMGMLTPPAIAMWYVLEFVRNKPRSYAGNMFGQLKNGRVVRHRKNRKTRKK
jgi:hypothetical protein